ncbi:fluoride efflux transporter CrcB [Acinetobacter equi]|uniref:Fluoride-specific ion channel FluC n=1 Tax=Acinetobacter equi TaxID=1324350 RepID=A0A0N7GY65_9GAMM|nr:fluoride efflux transporter CrcB [Acinetobacter equi]ALH96651.1 chromosome condensation protein CrcB [Acinetobacter equi]
MNWLLVACGGAIGASFRYGVSLWLAKPSGVFPWSTWSVNLFGCFLAGVFFAFSQKYIFLQTEARLFLMVGILGGFTTFSSFGLETFTLLKQGNISIALVYVMSSLIIGILLLAFGFYIFNSVLHTR